ncbi:TlpA family protein disulfide reductase [Zhouia sp. PK063]|uniref:TlpA family protein disulfide reductase n=1 Tax=Zhouia sp. PK063 TaxID=3373602 RepID=UPI0037997DDE
MSALLVLCTICGIYISCSNKSSADNENLSIKLKHALPNTAINFNSRSSQFLVLSLNKLDTGLYRKNFNDLKGISQLGLDSLMIMSDNLQNCCLSISVLKKNNQKARDKSNKVLKSSLTKPFFFTNIISGYKNGKQVIVVDQNNNHDFSDDTILKFDASFKVFDDDRISAENQLIKLDTLPAIPIQLSYYKGNKEEKVLRYAQVFPVANYYFMQLLDSNSYNTLKHYAVLIRLKDYWVNNLKMGENNYDIVVEGVNNNRKSISIYPKQGVALKENKELVDNFRFELNDTLKLGDDYYRLDSLSEPINTLTLKKLHVNMPYFGTKVGYVLKDYKMLDIDNRYHELSSIIDKNKPYTLLDFWGTWCIPCKEALPDLKKLHTTYANKLNVVSIALDKKIEEVKKVVYENEMNWPQSFIKYDHKKSMITDLNVLSYPTFIVLDSNRKIVYRGIGVEALIHVEEILKKTE